MNREKDAKFWSIIDQWARDNKVRIVTNESLRKLNILQLVAEKYQAYEIQGFQKLAETEAEKLAFSYEKAHKKLTTKFSRDSKKKVEQEQQNSEIKEQLRNIKVKIRANRQTQNLLKYIRSNILNYYDRQIKPKSVKRQRRNIRVRNRRG